MTSKSGPTAPPPAPYRMVKRHLPSRPYRLGSRRRRAKRTVLSEGGPDAARNERPPSLDTSKQLATSVANWLKSTWTEADEYRLQARYHSRLCSSVFNLFQTFADEGFPESASKWSRLLTRLQNCQKEWIGYRAACGCDTESRPALAVPIGCNVRMCPFCASHRSKNAREKIKRLFPKLKYPALLTLTIPNRETIRKHDYKLFRIRVRQFIAQHPEVQGGIYSLETTYNRAEETWHIHCHILCDLSAPLPPKFITDAQGEQHKNTIELAGAKVYEFKARKMRYEFDWLRLWGMKWGKAARKNAAAMRRAGDDYEFDEWVKATRAHEVMRWSAARRRYVVNEKLSQAELARRNAWNRENRRLVNIKPVDDRDGAAREVLKYITKGAAFSDLPIAVEQFITATHGARLVATFGNWYGVKIDEEPPDPNKPEDWRQLKCTGCGVRYKRIGCFRFEDLRLDSLGRWLLKAPLDDNSAGTVTRPTIRALEAREE